MSAGPRERLINATIATIRSRGSAGATVADLLHESGTARQSIYTHFPRGRVELIEQSVEAAGDIMSTLIESLTGLEPEDALRMFIEYWKATVRDSDYTAGCPIVAGALAGHESSTAVATAGDVFERWSCILTTSMEGHGVPSAAAPSLTTTTIAAVEGAVIMAIAMRSVEPLDRVSDTLIVLLRHYTEGRG